MNAHQRRIRRRSEDRSYGDFLAAMAPHCRCCSMCSPGLCGGVSAGGFCDELCFCGGDDEDEREEYDDGSEPFVSTCPGGFSL